MTTRAMWVLVSVLVLMTLGCKSGDQETGSPGSSETPSLAGGDGSRASLYFPGRGGALVFEEREIDPGEDGLTPEDVVAALLAGPSGDGAYAPFPEGTEVDSVLISQRGIAMVDLVSPAQSPPRSGSRAEMLSVYSIVNSLYANVPDLQGVILLWNGQQRATFAGHLDTGRPLGENLSLVAR